MFFIHGQYDAETEVGVVADRCGICDELNVLRVTRIVRKTHFYFIPIGSGTPRGTVYTCGGCKGKSSVERQYDQFLSEKAASFMSLGQILLKTNSRLAVDLACRIRLEREVENGNATCDDGADPRVKLALVKVADLNDEATALRFQSLLDNWEALNAASRLSLLHGIDAALDDQERRAKRKNFLNIVTQQFQLEVGGLQAIATFALVLGAGCAFSLKSFGRNGLAAGFVCSFFAAVILAVLVYWQYKRYVLKRFFRSIFLPELDNRQIEIESIVALLAQIDIGDKCVDERLRAMVKAMPLLKEVMAEQNRYLEMTNEEHAAPASR